MEFLLFMSSVALFTGLNRGHMVSTLKSNDRHLIICDWPDNGEGSTKLTQSLIKKLELEEASGLRVMISGCKMDSKCKENELAVIVQPDNMVVTLTEERLDAFVKFLHTREFLSAVESQHPFHTKEANWDALVLYFWNIDTHDFQSEAELSNITDQEFDEQIVKVVQASHIVGDVCEDSFVVYPPGLWYEPCYDRPLLALVSFLFSQAREKVTKKLHKMIK